MTARLSGFTLIELLVSVTMFLLAISIALTSIISSNSLMQMAESRSAVTDTVRDLNERLSNLTIGVSPNDVRLIKAVSYLPSSPPTDVGFTPTLAGLNTADTGFGIEIRRYGTSLQDNVCYLIGRGRVESAANGDKIFLDESGSAIVIIVSSLSVTSGTANCLYSDLVFKGTINNPLQSSVRDLDFATAVTGIVSAEVRYLASLETKSLGRADPKQRYARLDATYGLPLVSK